MVELRRPEGAAGALARYLSDADARYSAEHQMVGRVWSSPGYHTQVPAGAWVHPTRDNMEVALALLQGVKAGVAGEDAAARAVDILRKTLALQETDPTEKTYGIWPWLMEEGLAQMAPPDWNWADFNGAFLALMLVDHPAAGFLSAPLPADLIAAMRESLGHAAWAIFRRNVGPSYTNIAVLGGCVTAAAGELLDEPRLLAYGRRRLGNVAAHTATHGGFNEYNSPTYTMVVLDACEQTLHLVRDATVRAHAETLRQLAWRTIAEHIHPPTGQWAGPHSRAYRDRLDARARATLLIATGLMEDDGSLLRWAPLLPCPPEFVDRFRALPAPETVVTSAFIRSPEPWGSRTGTTWLAEAACLGTVDYEDFWVQRRPLIGYWRMPSPGGAPGAWSDVPPACLRLRFLHDGQDFASACGQHAQAENRVLTGFGLLTNHGDWHISLDRPADGTFQVEDLRIRYELDAEGAQVREVEAGPNADPGARRFEMSAGGFRVVITALPGIFGDRPVLWECAVVEGRVVVDGICYQGARMTFDPGQVQEIKIGAGLELLRPGEAPLPHSPVWQTLTPETVELAWLDAELTLALPVRAHGEE